MEHLSVLLTFSQILTALYLCLGTTSAASLEDWRTRTIYQVLTDRFARSDGSTTAECNVVDGLYCGGSWEGITNKLDYIQGMNFDAIWISPVVAQVEKRTGDGEAYTGYWATDLYSLNSNFGTADDLKQLVDAAHQRDMFVMLDVVVNHMGFAGEAMDVDYNTLNPFNDEKYFHTYCPIDGDTNQTEVEVCWLGDNIVALADLRTEDQEVRDMMGEWIHSLVSNYSFDGLRIDTTINVEPDFFPDFVDSSGVFATGETMDGDNLFVCRWAEPIGSILNYPIYYPLTRAFSNPRGNINDLVTTIYTMHENCADPTAFGSFSENHDVPRFTESTNDTALAKNIITFTLMADGIPIIYQGQEQHMSGGISPYLNRAPVWSTGYDTEAPLYGHIAKLTKARQHFTLDGDDYTTYATQVIYEDYHTIAMRKGRNGKQVITILTNNGQSTDDFELHVTGHGLATGTVMMEVLTCTNITVDNLGVLNIPMGAGVPKVLYPANEMLHSGMCGTGDALPKPSPTLIPTIVSTTIGGHATIVSISITEDASSPADNTPTPSKTRHALGSASYAHADARTSICVAILSILLASSGAFLIFW